MRAPELPLEVVALLELEVDDDVSTPTGPVDPGQFAGNGGYGYVRPGWVQDSSGAWFDEDTLYPNWDSATTFVISGVFSNPRGQEGGFKPRPGEEGRMMTNVASARAWAEAKYGRLHHNGRNLERPGSGRWAFRVDRPTAKEGT